MENNSLIKTDWYRLEETGVEFFGEPPSFQEFQEAVLFWVKLNRLTTWVIADLARFGEKIYGETYAQVVEATGLSLGRISNIVSVANRIPVEERRSLPFGHHATVAYMEPEERNKWLDIAEKEDFTREELREAIRAKVTVSSNGYNLDDTPDGMPTDDTPFTRITAPEPQPEHDGLYKLSSYDLIVEYVQATETGNDERSRQVYLAMKDLVKNSL
jgi:hypothetical protein